MAFCIKISRSLDIAFPLFDSVPRRDGGEGTGGHAAAGLWIADNVVADLPLEGVRADLADELPAAFRRAVGDLPLGVAFPDLDSDVPLGDAFPFLLEDEFSI